MVICNVTVIAEKGVNPQNYVKYYRRHGKSDPKSVSKGNMFVPQTLEDSIVPLKGAQGSLPTCCLFPQEKLISCKVYIDNLRLMAKIRIQ